MIRFETFLYETMNYIDIHMYISIYNKNLYSSFFRMPAQIYPAFYWSIAMGINMFLMEGMLSPCLAIFNAFVAKTLLKGDSFMANPNRSRSVEKGGKFGENHFSGKMYIPFDAGCQMNMQFIGLRP